jgi:hypothetical protein
MRAMQVQEILVGELENLKILRIKGFSDIRHPPGSKDLEDKNTTFRKFDLFPSSGEGRHLLYCIP